MESDSRPAGNGPARKSLGSEDDSTPSADNLWKLTERCPAEAVKWLSLGWRLGLIDGRDEGLHAAELDMAEAWHRVWLDVRKTMAQPTFAELAGRRRADHRPCPARCRKCSRCMASLAYWNRGGRPFAAGEVVAPW